MPWTAFRTDTDVRGVNQEQVCETNLQSSVVQGSTTLDVAAWAEADILLPDCTML